MKTSIPFVLAVVALLRSPCGWAAVVTTTADNGPGSLRQAIINATPGETLTFAVSGAIDLTSGELLITTNLTITGPGASQLTVRRSTNAGTADFRIFNLRSGTVTISGLTVNNGRTNTGGGIFNQARANLTMHDLVINGNAATDAGGGIKNIGTLALDHIVITDNRAGGGPAGSSGSGGGFDNESDLIASNSRIDNNTAVGGANGDGIGGGINNSATVLLMNCTVNGNRAEGSPAGGKAFGGGINSSGTISNFDCTISGNSAQGGAGSVGGGAQGGGIMSDRGTVHLERCTVSDNTAVGGNGTAGTGGTSDGGGVANECGTVTLENSTVSGNSAAPGTGTPAPGATPSGGIFNTCGTTVVNHSTIVSNAVVEIAQQPGCGVFNSVGSLELKNTILAGNTATFDLFSVESDTVASGGFNLIGRTNILISPGPQDRFNLTGADLKLGPLADNGGPTLTHALLCGSPAIDAGDSTNAPATDQRGLVRIFGEAIDIGGVEDRPPTVLCPTPTTLTANTSTGLLATVSVQVADAEGDSLDVIWSVDGVLLQTNHVTFSGPSIPVNISITNFFALGNHTIQLQASDHKGCEGTCSTTLEIRAPNRAPTALNDSYKVSENAVLTVPPISGVLTNDTDADGDALTAELVSGPTHAGSFTLNPDGSFSYTPAPNFVGTDSFTYRAKDSLTNSAPATVTITVLTPNSAPTALNDSYKINENAVLTVPPTSGVLTNDTDADGDALTAELVNGPTHAGSFTLNPDGSFSYTPAPNFVGTDSFTYRAKDSQTNSAPATVTITVLAPNSAPTALNDSYSVNENAALTVPPTSGVLTNDTDADGDALTAELVSGPTHAGSFTLNPDGSFSYTPAANFVGTDSFTYRARDSQTNSAPATVTITVKAGTGQGCDLYPIALYRKNLDRVQVGAVIADIYNGVQPGNFGWLTWTGRPNEPTLATSLTPPGDSRTYVNPNDRNDHVVSVGDWVQGKPGVTNSRQVREALEELKQIDITVPVWDQVRASGNNSLYRVAGFARVRLVSYQLPNVNRISARFLGQVDCP